MTNTKESTYITLMTGAVFTDDPHEYIDGLAALNKRYAGVGRVKEVYSSLQSSIAVPTARPDHRLKNVSKSYLTEYVKLCNDNDIIFNYTANASIIGNLETIDKNYDKYVEFFKWLESIGVGRTTIANPIMMKLVSKETNIPIEVSTIQNVRQPAEITRLKELYPNINKVCVAIDINRNINDLKVMQRVCDKIGVELEVIATEFCKTDRSNCVHRMHCYNLHAYNMSKDVSRLGINSDGTKQHANVKGYPWNGVDGCIFSRTKDNIPWLISNTVWPQVIDKYAKETGINRFKVTTRTAPPEYALWLVEAYFKRSFDGPLSKLWLQLSASDSFAAGAKNFEKLQTASENIVKYDVNKLTTPAEIHTTFDDGVEVHTIAGDLTFFDIFFKLKHVDWSKVQWVNKPTEELDTYESNWADKWHRLAI